MTTTAPAQSRRNATWYTNLALTGIVVLLGLHLVKDTPIDAAAFAQVGVVGNERAANSDDASGLISAAEQRKQMINELRSVSQRLERIESALAKGISVKVTSMPATTPAK